MSVQRTRLMIHTLDTRHPLWPACRMIRLHVFIEEQKVPVELEWDSADETAMHLLASVDDQPAACARVLPDGHIGRMAVLPEWRGRGIGMALLLQAIQVCRQLEVTHARLSAQTHAIAFYQQAGFDICSEPYSDANILHVDMQLELV
ncbi:Predicted N-acyltransferase, GNAT family [Methylophilus rhizosphaerae]|uniref:Predicted N-acyltransferase, GNAT family n=1 Tax=Methylophilus rhizosphaerae TaxID=492660 RepID=A0A1G9DUK1_9PROT|nr:GNAT family N-acetyltransferase [Methylophilus rhizosphaerae]SDK67519.1 Predicted N-acyltransferase, GNAT family [Methylophilus rhizosphaerae]